MMELYKDIVYRLPLGESKKILYIIFVYYSGIIAWIYYMIKWDETKFVVCCSSSNTLGDTDVSHTYTYAFILKNKFKKYLFKK